MAAVAEQHLTLEEFREKYGQEKPYFEYWDGLAIQKAVPTLLHAKLQSLIVEVLRELGYYSYSEVTLRIDPHWEPIPDVIGALVQPVGEYPTQPVDVVVEVLSPKDQFSLVQEKCERYSALGIKDIIVLDPVRQKAWFWHSVMKSLLAAREDCKFQSGGTLIFENIWSRLSEM